MQQSVSRGLQGTTVKDAWPVNEELLAPFAALRPNISKVIINKKPCC